MVRDQDIPYGIFIFFIVFLPFVILMMIIKSLPTAAYDKLFPSS